METSHQQVVTIDTLSEIWIRFHLRNLKVIIIYWQFHFYQRDRKARVKEKKGSAHDPEQISSSV